MGRQGLSLGAGSVTARRLTAALCAASVPFLQACGAGWHRTDIVTPESPRQQVEVWQGKSSQQWHAVRAYLFEMASEWTPAGDAYAKAAGRANDRVEREHLIRRSARARSRALRDG